MTSPLPNFSLIAFASAVILAGCAGGGASRSAERTAAGSTGAQTDRSEVHDRLIFEVDRWLGARYRYGGTDRSGFDCSGFVRRVYRDAFDEELPRTTREQVRAGRQIGRADLRLADLVFFRTSSRTDHVGVYIGNGEFAHASSSSGVMISHLAEPYWRGAYSTARRVLDFNFAEGSDGAAELDDSPRDTSALTVAPGSRLGW